MQCLSMVHVSPPPLHREVTALLTNQCSGSTQVNHVQKVTKMYLWTFNFYLVKFKCNFYHYERTYQTELNHTAWYGIIGIIWEYHTSCGLIGDSSIHTSIAGFKLHDFQLYDLLPSDNESCNCLPFKQHDLKFL